MTMPASMPAITLMSTPGRKQALLEVAAEADRRGFAGIYVPSMGGGLAFCNSLAHVTNNIRFGTSIQPIYVQAPQALAAQASHIHEVSGGRFVLGLGVSHEPALERMNIKSGKPLTDTRNFVAQLKEANPTPDNPQSGLPPIILATLRDKMVDLSVEISDGAVWANGSLNDIARSVERIPQERRDAGFIVGNMIPTIIDADKETAYAKHRRGLIGYVSLPNYRNYWKQAGFESEMEQIESAIDAKDFDKLPELMSDNWLQNVTLSGTAEEVREGVQKWVDAGVTTPILVPSALKGGHLAGVQQVFDAFS